MQTVKVHQASIDTYLEDVILTSLNRCADKEARSEVQQLAQNIDAVVHELEHRYVSRPQCANYLVPIFLFVLL